MKDYTPLLTEADHEAGFKEITVTTRSGKPIIIRLTPPPAMRAARIYQEHIADKQNFLPLLEESAPAEALKNLTLESIDELSLYAVALAYGAVTEKKILRPIRLLRQTLDGLSEQNLSRLLEQVSASAKSDPGPCPSSTSGTANPSPSDSIPPSSISTSPVQVMPPPPA